MAHNRPHQVTQLTIGGETTEVPARVHEVIGDSGCRVLVKVVNLTPHDVQLISTADSAPLGSIPASGVALRLAEETASETTFSVSHPLQHLRVVSYTAPVLPDAVEGTYFVVSLPTLQHLTAAGCDRPDLIAPDTGRAMRDKQGQTVGVYGFVRLAMAKYSATCGPCWKEGEDVTRPLPGMPRARGGRRNG